MKYVYDLTGIDFPIIREFDIVSDAAIMKGQVVKLDNTKSIIQADVNETTEVLGVAFEDHSGYSELLNQRSGGKKIGVYCSPTAVFECQANAIITASAGTDETMVSTDFTFDSKIAGGKLILIKKGLNSTLSLPIGTIFTITSYTAATQTFQSTFVDSVSNGDQFLLFPPFGYYQFGLNQDGLDLDFIESTGKCMKVVETDPLKRKIYIRFQRHLLSKVD